MATAAQCSHCGGGPGKKVGRCPKCGSSIPDGVQWLLILVGIVALFMGYQKFFGADESPKGTPLGVDSVQAAKAAAYADAAAQKKELAFRRVVMILRELKRAQRDPDSLVWEDISANEDASVMCILYRSRNGFGGMNKSSLVVANKKASDKSAAWNKHCSGPGKQLEQFDYAARAL